MPSFNIPIYLAAAVRTPIGKFGGGLSSLTAPELGTASAKATLARSGIDPNAVDEVIFGNARQAGVGPKRRGRSPSVADCATKFRRTRSTRPAARGCARS